MDELQFDAGLHSRSTYYPPSPQFRPSEENRKKVTEWLNERKEHETGCPGCGGPTQYSREIPPAPYYCDQCSKEWT